MHAQLIATILAVAGSALGGTLPSYSSTSTVTLYPSDSPTESKPPAGNPSCTVCPHPKDYDRNWKSESVLNDTRKHHSSFKLFAYPGEVMEGGEEARIPLHLLSKSDAGSPDFWSLHLAVEHGIDHNKDQPRWNLHDNTLQTDKSALIGKTLYFRLYDGKYNQDTEFWAGPVFHDVSVPHENQEIYKKANKAKLVAKKSWSLERDSENPLAYILKSSKPKGSFFACVDSESFIDNAGSIHEDMPEAGNELNESQLEAALIPKLFKGSQIVYSESNPKEPFSLPAKGAISQKAKGCMPLVIKVRCCPSHGFHNFIFVD